ncbi:MAG: AAA family ATPase, partial [Rubrivivax sp.]
MAEGGRVDAQNPWPWLDPFTEIAQHFFNGRDDDAQALRRCVLATPAVVLFGRSGLGKTSLLLAGLFPLLRERGLLPVVLRRVDHCAAAPSLSAQLLRALDEACDAAGIATVATGGPDAASDDDGAALWERLHDRRQRWVDADGTRWTPVIVIDQFEEVFTLLDSEAPRRRLFEALGDLVENRLPPAVSARLDTHDELLDHLDLDSQPYRCLLALREDFLPDLEGWADLIPRLGPNRYRLLPMSHDQALAAVQRTGGDLVDAESALRIVDFLGRQAGVADASARTRGVGDVGEASEVSQKRDSHQARRIEPALLSLVCASLNVDRLALDPPGLRIDVSQLDQRGSQILDRFYDDAFAGLDDLQRVAAARWVEANLITEGGTRRPYPMRAVDPALLTALRALVDRRLLRFENTEQGVQVELVHDRLAAVASARAWATQRAAEAAGKLQRDKEAAEFELIKARARAAELAQERAVIERARADEAVAAATRWRRVMTAFATAAVLAIGVSAVATVQWKRADAALKAQRAAQSVAAAAEESRKVGLEDAARVILKYGGSDSTAQADTLLAAAIRGIPERPNPDAAPIAAAAPPGPQPPTPVGLDCAAGKRLYPQVGSVDGTAVVERVAPALRSAGFIVPRTEVVASIKMPAATEIRYFRKSERDLATSAKDALERAGLPRVRIAYVSGFEE